MYNNRDENGKIVNYYKDIMGRTTFGGKDRYIWICGEHIEDSTE